ncbi:MAG: hypothetical protein KGR98_04170 [Verrucomicrobia bacterium]|nr:hypothetical protein [Verrucomicrobiota bacterium]MDE3099745.1 hypothetical protein [Verrucomicrobiota bacterium]
MKLFSSIHRTQDHFGEAIKLFSSAHRTPEQRPDALVIVPLFCTIGLLMAASVRAKSAAMAGRRSQ